MQTKPPASSAKLVPPGHKLHTIISWLSYYILPGFFLGYIIFNLFLGRGVYDFVVFSGRASFFFIAFLLFAKPIAVIFNSHIFEKILGFRRQLGVLAFWLAVFHGIALMFFLNIFSQEGVAQLYDLYGIVLPGFIGLMGMIILGLTSNNLSVIKLGPRTWKNIQRIAYAVFFFTSLHYYRVDGNILHWAVFTLYVIMKLAEPYFHNKHNREKRDLLAYNHFQDLPDGIGLLRQIESKNA